MAHHVKHQTHVCPQTTTPPHTGSKFTPPHSPPTSQTPVMTRHHTCVTPRREQLRDARRFQPRLAQPDHGAETRPPRAHHNRIILMVNDGVRMRRRLGRPDRRVLPCRLGSPAHHCPRGGRRVQAAAKRTDAAADADAAAETDAATAAARRDGRGPRRHTGHSRQGGRDATTGGAEEAHGGQEAGTAPVLAAAWDVRTVTVCRDVQQMPTTSKVARERASVRHERRVASVSNDPQVLEPAP